MVYLLHCINSTPEIDSLNGYSSEIKEITLPCTGKVTEIYLLKAFTNGADGVIILGCPEGACNYLKGNLHALSRVKRTRQYLDEVGLGGERLIMRVLQPDGGDSADGIVKEAMDSINQLGPSPLNK